MKPILAVVALLACTPAIVHGFSRISVHPDAALTECTLADTSPGVVNVHVAVTSSECGTGVWFRMAESTGFTGVWLSETSPYITVGSSRSDVSIAWGFALYGRIGVLTMTYQLLGTSTCSQLSIEPPVGFPLLICTGCIFADLPCYPSVPLHVNCSGPFDCNPVAIESATWGQIKALYRD